MPNKNYVRGRNKEYRIVHKWQNRGCLAQRSAGSHSPIDVFVIDHENKIVRLIQAKPNSMSDNKKKELLDSLKYLNGTYKVEVSVE
jgi:hypothetical protein